METWDLLDEDFESEYFEDTFTVVVIYDIISNKQKMKIIIFFKFTR